MDSNTNNIPQSGNQMVETNARTTLSRILSAVLLLVLMIGGISLNWKYVTRILKIPQTNTPSVSGGVEEKQVSEGEDVITVKPGEAHVLADKETMIRFGNTKVPDVIFGEHYSLNDIHKINFLPILKKIEFYRNGYRFSLENEGCRTETRFTDVPEVWVTDCTIRVKSVQAAASAKSMPTFSRSYSMSGFRGVVSDGADQPFVHVDIPSASLWHNAKEYTEDFALKVGRMTSHGSSTTWDIQLITAYGIDTIRYQPAEIWKRETKEVQIGALTVTATLDEKPCSKVGVWDECNSHSLTLSFNQEKQEPIQIISYTE